ncbi:MAG: amidohydrolase family protein [Bacteroidetes bacterium]|jgi:N-acyl-D-amino-acid deacylase|nr:amidohydrolase family protein [Bacteroidota bacterium]
MRFFGLLLVATLGLSACSPPDYDVILRGGTVYDGSGDAPVSADVGIRADTIAAVGDLSAASGATEIDAEGLAVAPGFINMLSWATNALIIDGRSQSDIRQGVTLEVFGEGWSMGPLNDAMKRERLRDAVSDLGALDAVAERLGVEATGDTLTWPWTTLGDYLNFLEQKGVAPNVASFVGATTVRIHEMGYADRAPTPDELERMRGLVRQAMDEGALGVGSSLIYAPAFYADTDELIALAEVAAEDDGMYISHLRSEGNRLLEALDELITIARAADIQSEVYHLKAAGRANWDKLGPAIERIEAARDAGLGVAANMYTYTAGSTGLNAAMPPWVQEGGFEAWRQRLQDPAIRARVAEAMDTPTDEWENLYLAAGADNVLLTGFRQDSLRSLIGQTLAEVAADRGTTPAETAMDLVVADSSRVDVVYFLMSEENVKRQIALPWMTFGSDAGSMATEGVFLESNTHPRAYGNFARLLGKYVREERVIPLEEAIHRLTALPAERLNIRHRGRLEPGYFADLALFDPEAIQDHATYEDPHQYATGMRHVIVNGTPVLRDGEPTGATPGRFVRGPGWTGWDEASATQ